jgi:hypothetical protein
VLPQLGDARYRGWRRSWSNGGPARGPLRATPALLALASAALVAGLPADAATAAGCGQREVGASGGDRLAGGGGGDRLRGRAGRDRLRGRGGRDCLFGGPGHDRLSGGGGGDRLVGGTGRDRLRGGPGRDRLRARGGGRDVVVCGSGRDRVSADERDVVRGCRRRGTSPVPGYAPVSQLGPVPGDALYVSPAGSDSNPGTAASPWRTIARAVDGSGPGDTVVLRAGTYGAKGVIHEFDTPGSRSAPVTFRGDPAGPMPRILGHVRISADHVRLNYLLFDGPTGSVKEPTADNPRGEQVQITVLGPSVDGVEISDSVVRGSKWHAGIYLCTATDVRITGNYIHHNGDRRDPGQENQSHGIYFESGSGLVANNVIAHNVARGVQLYARPRNVVIANNTIVRNGKAGIQFASDTAQSRAVNNVVAYNGEHGIRSSGLTGNGNVVQRNVVWGNGQDLGPADGLKVFGNLRSHPGFGPRGDYRPAGGSPVVDRAAGGYSPVRDFDGVARPRGAAPDLGAFEVG